jgi:hypothetical protein
LKNTSFTTKDEDEVRAFLGNGAERLIELSVPIGKVNHLYSKGLYEFKE